MAALEIALLGQHPAQLTDALDALDLLLDKVFDQLDIFVVPVGIDLKRIGDRLKCG